MKKSLKVLFLILRLVAICSVTVLTVYAMFRLDYIGNLNAVDNLIGALPLIALSMFLVSGIVFFIPKKKNGITLNVMSGIVLIFSILAFSVTYNGNVFPLATSLDTSSLEAPSAVIMPVETPDEECFPIIKGDYPRLDGATALYPVYSSVAEAVYESTADEGVLVCSNTPGAYNSIIKGDCDIIFVAGPSKKQLADAEQAGVELCFTPIGKEAFVFLVSSENPINNVTTQQLHNIYSGKTSKWRTLGWAEGGDIIAFRRPEGSGSETGLQSMMGDLPVAKSRPLPDASLAGRGRLTEQISVEWGGVHPALGYSYRYYATKMYPNENSKLLSVDGVSPSAETISSGEYPFASEFYAVTRGKPEGNEKLLIDWILSDVGQRLIEKVGYVPLG